MPDSGPENGGSELAAYVDEELSVERNRRGVVEGRGTSLITTSSAFATLLFAAIAILIDNEAVSAPVLSLIATGSAFVAFLAAAGCGVMVGRAPRVTVVRADQLLAWRNNDDDVWNNSGDNVRWLLVRARILTLSSLRTGSNRMMQWAVRGWVAELFALLLLCVAVIALIAEMAA